MTHAASCLTNLQVPIMKLQSICIQSNVITELQITIYFQCPQHGKMIYMLLLSIMANDSKSNQCGIINDNPTKRCKTGYACSKNICVKVSTPLREPDCIRKFSATGTCKRFLCDNSGKKNCESGYSCKMFGKSGFCKPVEKANKSPQGKQPTENQPFKKPDPALMGDGEIRYCDGQNFCPPTQHCYMPLFENYYCVYNDPNYKTPLPTPAQLANPSFCYSAFGNQICSKDEYCEKDIDFGSNHLELIDGTCQPIECGVNDGQKIQCKESTYPNCHLSEYQLSKGNEKGYCTNLSEIPCTDKYSLSGKCQYLII
eukprot:NODE_682_length_4785_cov_0.471831.p3 type:complete len:313 gc:universal NODE_682_length_4785_cov_0.471831:1139-2077(+)